VPGLPSGNREAANDGESCDMGRFVGRPERVIVTEDGIGAKGGMGGEGLQLTVDSSQFQRKTKARR